VNAAGVGAARSVESRPAPRLVFFVFMATLLTRLPFIRPGYGLDPDSYRLVIATREIADGTYRASRLPGYPVHEYLVALTPARYDPLMSNLLTATFSALAVMFFFLLLSELKVRQPLLLTAAFAFVPIFFIHSVDTMDYVFALAFLLAGTYFVVAGRPAIGGVMLGLAIGSRITSGAMLVPLTLWIVLARDALTNWRRHAASLWLGALAVGALCFIPVFARYGLGFWAFADNVTYPTARELLEQGVLQVWGRLGTLGLLAALLAVPFLRATRLALGDASLRPTIALSLSAVAIYVVAFLRLPHEVAYLLPAVPFVLLLLGLVLPDRLLQILALLVILSPFLTFSRYGPSLQGPVLANHQMRVERQSEIDEIVAALSELPEDAVLVAGPWRPALAVALYKQVGYPDVVEFLREGGDYSPDALRGRAVYYMPGIAESHLRATGIDLEEVGARPLEVGFIPAE
jgi:hypothetical protein